MFRTPQGATDNLEDHLRGMILNSKIPNLPDDGQKSRTHPQTISAETAEPSENPSRTKATDNSAPFRKRPNQAQRRQINSQLMTVINSPPFQRDQGPWPGSPSQNVPQPQPLHPFPTQPYPPYHNFPRHQGSIYQNFSNPLIYVQDGRGRNQYHHNPISYLRPFQGHQMPHGFQNYSQPRGNLFLPGLKNSVNQGLYLDKLIHDLLPIIRIQPKDVLDKEKFRSEIEICCQETIYRHELKQGNTNFDASSVELRCYGSMMTGFATKASDMDLALFTPYSDPPCDSPISIIPRLLEKKLLDMGYGSRLLTRTRVPIIQLCEKPSSKLLSDLLQERAKWEPDIEKSEEDQATPVVKHGANKRQSTPASGRSSAKTCMKSKKSKNTGLSTERISSLRQQTNQSLSSYYKTAKRILREQGGRDWLENAPELSHEERCLLNEVCKAFIQGLSSNLLSLRLQKLKSIRPLFDVPLPRTQGSLLAVFNLTEGEQLTLVWESFPLRNSISKAGSKAEAVVKAWRALQDIEVPMTGNFAHNRKLHLTCKELKETPSLQLALFEQENYEDPARYFERANQIMERLKHLDENESDDLESLVISQYISGIKDYKICKNLQQINIGAATLQQIGRQHRILQLADDYEHALQLGLYADCDRDLIEQFVQKLKSLTLHAPYLSQAESTVAKLLSLPDPTKVSLNKRDIFYDRPHFSNLHSGIKCDINFSADLAIHNTHLLRCYSSCDPRVKDMVIFIKHWAKTRDINTPFRGTLSSYGYVLMALHYLINIAQPFVCPNLQHIRSNLPYCSLPSEAAITSCMGKDVRFWRNELEIKSLAEQNLLNQNRDSIGELVRGFFEYFAQNGQMSNGQGQAFHWGRDVLSLRTMGGLLSKQEKGWVSSSNLETTTVPAPSTKAFDTENCSKNCHDLNTHGQRTNTIKETKEVRQRYMFAIEDPFELDHNVARTVTYNGIASIRNEFRRAWRIIRNIGTTSQNQEVLIDPVSPQTDEIKIFRDTLSLLHDPYPKVKQADV